MTLDDIVKTAVWLKKAANFAVYAASFDTHRRARSTVMSGIVPPSASIEIDAVARRRAVVSPTR